MITCKEATDWISRKEEKKLSFSQQVQLWMHLLMCVYCRLFYRQNREIVKNARHLHSNDAGLSDAEKQALSDRLRSL